MEKNAPEITADLPAEKKKKRASTGTIVTIVAAVLIVFAVVLGLVLTNDSNRAVKVKADDLVNAFVADVNAANELYVGKAIRVTGKVVVANVNADGSGYIAIVPEESDAGAKAIQAFYSASVKSSFESATVGSVVTVSGVCAGVKQESNIILNESVLL